MTPPRPASQSAAPGVPTSPSDDLRLPITGAVVCGGESRRMGNDKARLEVGGRSLLEHVVDVLSESCTRVVLATGAQPRYPELGLDCVLDRVAGAGPLAGLEAALGAMPPSDEVQRIVVFACDMPHVSSALVRALYRSACDSNWDVCLVESDEGVEPLAAVYTDRCLPAVRAALDRGARRLIAFHSDPTLKIGTVPTYELPMELRSGVVNVNTPSELERVRAEVTGGLK